MFFVVAIHGQVLYNRKKYKGCDVVKIKFLGTAAAEGVPSFFCDCEKCQKSRRLGGRNIRTRSQAIIDGKLLIDFGPDTYSHFVQYGIDFMNVEDCLITHIHEDHLYEKELDYFRAGFSRPREGYTFTLHGSEDLNTVAADFIEPSRGCLKLNIIKPFEPFSVGEYTVTALKAWHGTENPYIYLISDGKKTALYANDTDIFPEDTWEYLEKIRPHIDLVAMDCTNGNSWEIKYRGHMGMIQNVECKKRLYEMGLTNAGTVHLLNHFSHNGVDVVYDDFVDKAANHGFLVTFDGMEAEI